MVEFESHPLAAASIGQVHRAVLKDKREVAMKIQVKSIASISLMPLCIMRWVILIKDLINTTLERTYCTKVKIDFPQNQDLSTSLERPCKGL